MARWLVQLIQAASLFGAGVLVRDAHGRVHLSTVIAAVSLTLLPWVVGTVFDAKVGARSRELRIQEVLETWDFPPGSIHLVVYTRTWWWIFMKSGGRLAANPRYLKPRTKYITPTGPLRGRDTRRVLIGRGIVGVAFESANTHADSFKDDQELIDKSVNLYKMPIEEAKRQNLDKRAIYCIPIYVFDNTFGIIYLSSNDTGAFDHATTANFQPNARMRLLCKSLVKIGHEFH